MRGDLPLPGDVLGKRFEIVRVIGRGGMGVVYEAKHLGLGRPVALKALMLQDDADPTEAVARFLREAKLAAKLESPHTVRVVDAAISRSHVPYIVMELLVGHDLARELKTRGAAPVPYPQAVDWILQACVGVAEAHAAGVIHRDLKPGNLFLARELDGSVKLKVMDFGLSKQIVGRAGDTSLTHGATALGTPSYMAPEQMIAAKDVDARADVWSLGVVLYRCLTGRLPFSTENPTALAFAIATQPIAPPASLVPGLPAALSDVVMGALERDPLRRPRNALALGRALAPFGSGAFVLERALKTVPGVSRMETVRLPTPPPPPPPPAVAPPPAAAPRPGLAGPVLLVLACVATAVGVLGFARVRGSAVTPIRAERPAPVVVPSPSAFAEPAADAAAPGDEPRH